MKRDGELKISSCQVNSVLGAINFVLDLIMHGGELEVEANASPTPHPFFFLSICVTIPFVRAGTFQAHQSSTEFLPPARNYVLVKAQISSFMDCYAKNNYKVTLQILFSPLHLVPNK